MRRTPPKPGRRKSYAGRFEESAHAKGLDPGNVLATLLQSDGEPDVDGFWQDVSTNLDAKRLRLLFVADDIPDPLKRVVEFLNGQMPAIEVLAVEIKQFPRQFNSDTCAPGHREDCGF